MEEGEESEEVKFIPVLITLILIYFIFFDSDEKWYGIMYYNKNDLSKYEEIESPTSDDGSFKSEEECLNFTEEMLDRKGLGLVGDLECFEFE